MPNSVRVAVSSIAGFAAFALLLFLPAGTVNYWQGWAFLGVFTVVSLAPTIVSGQGGSRDCRAADECRAAGRGPARPESRRGRDRGVFRRNTRRCPGSTAGSAGRRMPTAVSMLGLVMVAVGLGLSMLVIFQNRYAAANIVVEKDQPLGHHGAVRHCAASDVLRQRGHDDRHAARAWVLLGTAGHYRRPASARHPHSRRGEAAQSGVDRIPATTCRRCATDWCRWPGDPR